mmetsp:Transcript_40715/g.66049  ORF Transcript_40715/g.66049 Transcript_40715/m.66049 type:complete len:151 (+) Transcript_40715:69-521(+)|eukprot:CAMPEP_0184655570 /NCGR_PEP_ID=MMETSP0308-20130426/13600_1 /TAXON_ID=38269 /ORGANISM="Gloeochaete witrockiana, Strain SAG 46.84" /LENGTH=150 /DNA_ID=CAMNT_0027092115 /DNA_START=66 /DNA_END=518 /DNA_ORIENTATION=+
MPAFAVDKDLMEFYGIGCDHCDDMKPKIHEVERELGRSFARYEVWYNQKNLQILQKLDQGFCGGIPFFYNRKTRDYICGATTTENLRNWATGRPFDSFTQAEKKPFSWDEWVKENKQMIKDAQVKAGDFQKKFLPFTMQQKAIKGKKVRR